MSIPTRTCVKVASIRPKYNNLKEWMEDSQNLYIGRKRVVFIDGQRFPPENSKWANIFTVKKYGREKAIQLYKEYITEKISKGELDIKELKEKTLGCFCSKDEDCHSDVLIKLFKDNVKLDYSSDEYIIWSSIRISILSGIEINKNGFHEAEKLSKEYGWSDELLTKDVEKIKLMLAKKGRNKV